MQYKSLEEFVGAVPTMPSGVVAVLLCESAQCVAASAERLASQGIAALITLGPAPELSIDAPVHRIDEAPSERGIADQMNKLIDALSGRWVLWLWNGEFFVFPYCETRCLADLTGFLTDERRSGLYSYAFDLFADELPVQTPAETTLYFDTTGYHAFPKENQQLRVFGGLGWRFQEFLPSGMQQIGRTSLFRASKGAHFGKELVFVDPDLSTVSCPWHHNPTGAVMSLRRARRILAHPNYAATRNQLLWQGSRAFEWNSRQLLEEGLIEPGQWF